MSAQQTVQVSKKIEPEDYAYLSQLVVKDLENYKIGTAQYKRKNNLLQILKKKAKKANNQSGVKEASKWLCLTCNEIHEKVDSVRKCIACGSEDVEKQKKREDED